LGGLENIGPRKRRKKKTTERRKRGGEGKKANCLTFARGKRVTYLEKKGEGI